MHFGFTYKYWSNMHNFSATTTSGSIWDITKMHQVPSLAPSSTKFLKILKYDFRLSQINPN